ncbi:MAG TPA: hypothetical protein PLV42_12500 [bacterium]|nr:hypothetical protein [bacterium]
MCRVLLSLLPFFLVTTLSASSLLELVGAPDSTNPFNARTIPIGGEAAYFNPSLLVDQQDSAKAGFFMMVESLFIDHFKKDPRYNVTEEIYQAASNEINNVGNDVPYRDQRFTPLPTKGLLSDRGTNDYDDIKMVIALGATKTIIEEWLTLGLYMLLPATSVQTQTPYYNDEREQYFSNSLHFELLEDRSQQFNIAFGLGGKVNQYLHLGAGLSFTSYTLTETDVYVPDSSNPAFQILNTSIKVTGSLSPHFSFAAYPIEDLIITETVHLQSDNGQIELQNKTQVWGWDYGDDPNDPKKKVSHYLASSGSMTYGYEPLRVGWGISYAFNLGHDYKLAPVIGGMWSHWATYENRHGEKPQDRWSDTVTASAGLHLKHEERQVGFDFQFVQTPVPDQTGRETYIDNHRLIWAGGWTEYFEFEKVTIAGGVQAQLQWLLYRTTMKDLTRTESDGGVVDEFPDDAINYSDPEQKPFASAQGLQTNNPGFPGFRSGGFLIGTGLFMKILY